MRFNIIKFGFQFTSQGSVPKMKKVLSLTNSEHNKQILEGLAGSGKSVQKIKRDQRLILQFRR